jgi:hypothetical protein
MKRYTFQAAIHDAKIFNHLRRDYRRTRKNRHKHSSSGWLSRHLAGVKHFTAIPQPSRHSHSTACEGAGSTAVEILAVVVLLLCHGLAQEHGMRRKTNSI